MKSYKTAPWQERFIRKNSTEYTCQEMADKLNLTRIDVNNFCHREKLDFKMVRKKKVKKIRTNPTIIYIPPVKHAIKRPPAIYGNIPSPYGLASELHNR